MSIKNLLITVLFQSFAIISAFGQSTELSIHLNSGLSSFGGESAGESTFININENPSIDNYTNNPYGKKMGLSYGLAAQVQRVTENKSILGLQAGFEMLRSKIDIERIEGYFDLRIHTAEGQTVLQNTFANIYPNFGHRFMFKSVALDLTAGPEIAFFLNSKEKGEATEIGGNVVTTDYERNHPTADVRGRFALTAKYQQFGISLGYSYGLTNYTRNMEGGDRENFARLIRFGFAYTLK